MGEEVAEVASCSSVPEPPDRRDFERSLEEINQKIKSVSDELMETRQNSDLKKKREQLQAELDSIKEKLDSRKPKLEKLKNDIREKETVLTEMENDVIFKDEKKLEDCLKKAQEVCEQRGFTSLRENQVLAKRLDILHRNLEKLQKYNKINEEKRILIEMERAEKDKQKILFQNKRSTANKLSDVRRRLDSRKKAGDRLAALLKELFFSRNELIKKYGSNAEQYTSWRMRQRETVGHSRTMLDNRGQAYPETFPVSRHRQQTRFRINEEEELLEPFYEYKTACRRLIVYLESLYAQTEDGENNSSCGSTSFNSKKGLFAANEDEDDSADEFPESFILLKSYSSLPNESSSTNQSSNSISVLPVLKKKFNKRSCKKPSQPINHMLCFINLFNEVHVPIPYDYKHVGRALEEVKARLEACKEKTNIVVWEDSDYQKMAVSSLSSTDSYWNGSADTSEVSSVGGNSLTHCPLSNTQLSASLRGSVGGSESNTAMNHLAKLSLHDSGMASGDGAES